LWLSRRGACLVSAHSAVPVLNGVPATFWFKQNVRQEPNWSYVVQAMEFDTLFLDNGFKYWFGTQCSYGHGTWDLWNTKGHYWQHLTVPCHKWAPGSWHTVTWYLERDPNKKYVHFVVLQVDGIQ